MGLSWENDRDVVPVRTESRCRSGVQEKLDVFFSVIFCRAQSASLHGGYEYLLFTGDCELHVCVLPVVFILRIVAGHVFLHIGV